MKDKGLLKPNKPAGKAVRSIAALGNYAQAKFNYNQARKREQRREAFRKKG